jgi:hypothetical protein
MRAAFRAQAHWGEKLASPWTALLCATLAERLDDSSRIGRRLLTWPGDSAPEADNVPARLCAGLQYLALSGAAPAFAALYPPAPPPDPDCLWSALAPLLDDERLSPWLDNPPQTNEPGRSAILYSGMLVLAERFRLPLRLFELGSSAGLNLVPDRYRYQLGGLRFGDPASPLLLAPRWTGAPPPKAMVEIVARAGVDLKPGNAARDGDKLLAYVWPGHDERRERLERAIAVAAVDPPMVEQGEAAAWLETVLPLAPTAGAVRVVMHSVAFQYFPAATQQRIVSLLEEVGSRAQPHEPLAWLRFEWEQSRLTIWPGGEELHLAHADPHGGWIDWLIGSGPDRP